MDASNGGSHGIDESFPPRPPNAYAGPLHRDANGQPIPVEREYRSQNQSAASSSIAVPDQRKDLLTPGTGRRSSEKPRTSESHDDAQGPHGRRPSASRTCGKCGQILNGQFVRALGDTFHLDCFTCNDCGKIVASKFFPVSDDGPNQYPLCETDYFKRLDLLCHECGGALRGSYITALERKYHIEHFTCSVCPTVFGSQDSYYEHEGQIYCHYHYSTKFAQRCNGCQTAILKQFVEIFRNGQDQHWHPECYMIHKYWNVRLRTPGQASDTEMPGADDADEAERIRVRGQEEQIEEKVLWIWRTLSAYEEKSAGCISDMLLHVSNGAYVDGVMSAKKFILHVELLFSAADNLDRTMASKLPKGLSYSREAKLLCKKVVAFFQLLAESQDTGVRRLGVTQELLSLVTGLAHYLKLLIRICLQGSLKLEREVKSDDGLRKFLEEINTLETKLSNEGLGSDSSSDIGSFVHISADTCPVCNKPVEDRCFRRKDRVMHVACVKCASCQRDLHLDPGAARYDDRNQRIYCTSCVDSQVDDEEGLTPVTRLQQYVHLLKVAHARLLATLRTSGALPHTSDDPNLEKYDSSSGLRVQPDSLNPPMLTSDSRSRSFTGQDSAEDQPGATYEQTLGDIRRLRSTRMDKHLSSNLKHARTSRIIGGPEGDAARPGSAGDDDVEKRNEDFRIINDPTGDQIPQITFGKDDMMKLDDIPRMVAAERAKEQRPNATKYARDGLFHSGPTPRLSYGHRRNTSGAQELEKLGPDGHRPKKFLSELSALEYFIVRHVAVLSMSPLLEGHFNQEELLDLIETRKPTFWGKFGKAFGINDKTKAGRKKGVFGVALDQLVERDGVDSEEGIAPGSMRIPTIVQDACMAMRQMDMSMEGVFRKNGNIRKLKEMAETIDTKGAEMVDMSQESPVQIAALLKKFLRELPDPVMTFKLNRLFITSQKIQDLEKRKRVLHLALCLLPKSHRETMEVLFCFLTFAASFSVIDEETGSKMDIHNLATVIAPNILFSNSKTEGMEDSFLAIEAVHSMMRYNSEFSEVPEDLQEILNDSSLFSGSADITTKEILKRYGDIGSRQPAHSFSSNIPQHTAQYDNQSRPFYANYISNSPKFGPHSGHDTYGSPDSLAQEQAPYQQTQSSRNTGDRPVIHRVDTGDAVHGSRPAHGTMGNNALQYPQQPRYGPTPGGSPLPAPNGFYANPMSGSKDSFASTTSLGRYRYQGGYPQQGRPEDGGPSGGGGGGGGGGGMGVT